MIMTIIGFFLFWWVFEILFGAINKPSQQSQNDLKVREQLKLKQKNAQLYALMNNKEAYEESKKKVELIIQSLRDMGIDIDIELGGDEPLREGKSLPPPLLKVETPQLKNTVVDFDEYKPLNEAESYALLFQGLEIQYKNSEIEVLSQIISERKIPFLTHFTHIENLESIIKNGIIPKSRIQSEDIVFRGNDQIRLDGNLDFSSFSISFPNEKMFFKYRRINESNNDADWVVLLIDCKILYEKDCLFCHTNAASNAVTTDQIKNLKTPDAFNKMFDNERESHLKPYDPTDVQAEVMIKGTVEPKHIIKYIFSNASLAQSYRIKFPSIIAEVDPSFFSTRKQARTIYRRN